MKKMVSLRLDDALIEEAKDFVRMRGGTFTELVRDGIREMINQGPDYDMTTSDGPWTEFFQHRFIAEFGAVAEKFECTIVKNNQS